MAGSLTENGKIEFGHRIGGQHLYFRAGRQAFQGLARVPDGCRAGHAAAIHNPNVRTLLIHV